MAANTFSPVQQRAADQRRTPVLPRNSSIAVIGAGAFGGWTALHLLRSGFKVTLIDAWGPGNSRSSSGDETRVIRSTYGANEFYFDLNVRSVELWKELEVKSGRSFFMNTGAIWFCYNESTPTVDDSIPFARKHGIEYEYLSKAKIQSRFPEVNNNDLHHAYVDPSAGYVLARESCHQVVHDFCKEGGHYIHAAVTPGPLTNNKIDEIHLSDGSTVLADVFVFACGSWLSELFPDCLGSIITCTRQEVYYFGVPGERSGFYDSLPVWVDVDGKDFYYGIPGNQRRGFKIGVDIRGESFNPTSGERTPDPAVLKAARDFIGHRFPGLKNAPLLESRVCPYENSPDGNFVFDHHPEAANCWFLGGGSGHGFKHGPGLGELVASFFRDGQPIPSLFHRVATN